MKDIDFDELDKAVNSLMATTPQPATAAPVPIAPPVPAVDTPTSTSSEPVPVTTSQPVPVVTRPVAPATRRAGRFMDMVHTSSDMKQREGSTSVTASSREGLAITPRSEPAESPTIVPTPTPTQPLEQTPDNALASMPDPIDVTFAQQPDISTVEAEPAVASTVAPGESALETEQVAPIESPFLADAKVEKRPLNAGTTDVVDTPAANDLGLEMDSLQDTSHDYTDSAAAKKGDEPPVSPQIPELNSDLVAIESSDKVVTQAVESAEVAAQVEAPAVPLGASSIAQQYTTQASTGDQSHAAIYDASQYPEPVTHPAKHKSGWLWVLWVVLLLAVGAGGAVLLYTFGIIP